MKTMDIREFGAQAAKTLDLIAKSREGLIVTKHGRPMVQITPCASTHGDPQPGKLAHTLVFEKDVITPVGENHGEPSR